MSDSDPHTHTEKGAGLARGPALIMGTILLAAGLYFLYRQHHFPSLSNFPSSDVKTGGDAFLGIFGVNGWSGELTAIAGGALLFGSAQHLLAKTMSLIVGVVLAVVAVWAIVDGDNGLGLFAANIWTKIGWIACAVILLINTLAPRRKTEVEDDDGDVRIRDRRAERVADDPADGSVAIPTADTRGAEERR